MVMFSHPSSSILTPLFLPSSLSSSLLLPILQGPQDRCGREGGTSRYAGPKLSSRAHRTDVVEKEVPADMQDLMERLEKAQG